MPDQSFFPGDPFAFQQPAGRKISADLFRKPGMFSEAIPVGLPSSNPG
jgi:hypothetical protein